MADAAPTSNPTWEYRLTETGDVERRPIDGTGEWATYQSEPIYVAMTVVARITSDGQVEEARQALEDIFCPGHKGEDCFMIAGPSSTGHSDLDVVLRWAGWGDDDALAGS